MGVCVSQNQQLSYKSPVQNVVIQKQIQQLGGKSSKIICIENLNNIMKTKQKSFQSQIITMTDQSEIELNKDEENIISIYIQHGHLTKHNMLLRTPNFVIPKEQESYLNKFTVDHYDYKQYDCFCMGFMILYLLVPEINFEYINDINSEDDIQNIINSLDQTQIPQLLFQSLKYILHYDKDKLLSMEQIEKSLNSLMYKGPQTLFKHDSLGAFLDYNDIYIFNDQLTSENSMEQYYSSYIIRVSDIKEVQKNNDKDNNLKNSPGNQNIDDDDIKYKEKIQIYEGPRKYFQHKSVFYFYDPHNSYFYSISDCRNVFENGIRYQWYDSNLSKGDFMEGVLKFACPSTDLFELFCSLGFKIECINYVTEVQHGVFIMHAAKNIFILDFNFKCFYSLASLHQLQSYEKNKKNQPLVYQNAYETRNQPFEIKFQYQNSKGRNVIFQDGYLQIIGRYEIETVLCQYKIVTEQACLIMTIEQKLKQLEDFRYQIKLFDKKVNSKYLITSKECFISQKQGKYYVNIVEEPKVSDLETEIKDRKKGKNYFQPKEIAYILKRLFKGILFLQRAHIKHGNIFPYQLNFVQNGNLKLGGWYQENRKEFNSDFEDGCLVLLSCMTLEIYDSPISLQKLETFKPQIMEKYPGIYSFIKQIIQKPKAVSTSFVKKEIKSLYTLLQRENLDRIKLNSQNNHIFWIGYGSNFIISKEILQDKEQEGGFSTSEVIQGKNDLYKFSKYNMFTFDAINTMYMVGAIKEDLQQQEFFSLDFGFQVESQNQIKLKQLEPIPFPILAPSLIYNNKNVYCFGGYEVFQDGSKSVSNKAFIYNIRKKKWSKIQDLPVSLVNSTPLLNNEKQLIYLFGGVSQEVDLSSKELTYFVYNIAKNSWELKVDFSIKSPFVNQRFIKPIIDLIADNLFVSYNTEGKQQIIEFFELYRGGIRLKYKKQIEIDKIQEEQKKLHGNVFSNQEGFQEYNKVLQDDLSMIVKGKSMYILDEVKKDLIQIKFDNIQKIEQGFVIPCNFQRDKIEEALENDEKIKEVGEINDPNQKTYYNRI
ncbi:Protein kinase-like domain [Pseudocohnilembus persalinus]|uniref:Protein kinase-like domain n=1 Tax=Pseudocohnilembus persalinus TaxID=266149 RepID=A0A0V0QFB7_PSEPJ|nr:Protein kinase-like domain [Pseudocohnilembus persalinus]|eukprot:KRX00902.1 Protein kinase-like domain [Pseudocohnilembus persalinus]